MTNELLVFGKYQQPTEAQKALDEEIKFKAKALIDAIDAVPMPSGQKEAAKRDIITGMMWVIKGIYVY